MLRAILFPYANYFIQQKINSQINRRFAKEFARLVVLMNHIIRIMADLDPIESFNDEKYIRKEILRKSLKT